MKCPVKAEGSGFPKKGTNDLRRGNKNPLWTMTLVFQSKPDFNEMGAMKSYYQKAVGWYLWTSFMPNCTKFAASQNVTNKLRKKVAFPEQI